MKKLSIYCIILLVSGLAACQKKAPQAMYEGKDLSKSARILRDKTTKAAALEIDVDGPWKIYSGSTVETIDFSTPLLTGEAKGTFPLNVSRDERSYFQLETEDGKAILAERHLPMTGGFNFRDLGGIRTKDGKYIKWGKLFRSDELSTLTESDLAYLSAIPIKTIVDFRSQAEIDAAEDLLPSSAVLYKNLNIEPGNIMQSNISFDLSAVADINFNQLMMGMNRLLATDSTAAVRYTEFFELVQDENNIPLMYHCTAGKDRTGMAAALILFSLGVDEQTIMNDYILSAQYLKDKYGRLVEQYPAIAPLMTVKPEFLQAGIDEMKNKYGSVDNYIQNVLKIDTGKMKKMFLY